MIYDVILTQADTQDTERCGQSRDRPTESGMDNDNTSWFVVTCELATMPHFSFNLTLKKQMYKY